jgi:hypothetical protein
VIDQDATLDEIRQAGVDALLRALGPVGMVRFLQQYTRGHGDYTRDRHEWLGNESVDELGERIMREQAGYRLKAR